MSQSSSTSLPLTIGLDLGAKSTQCAVFGVDRQRIEERKVATTRAGLTQLFERFPGARIVMEASTPTRWIAKLAESHGHEVIIANPRRIPLITASVHKSDRNDARLLGSLGQFDPALLSPIRLRADRFQAVRVVLFARDQLVKQRTAMVTFVRSMSKTEEVRLPACSTDAFAKKMSAHVPAQLRASLQPIFETIQVLSAAIKTYDAQLDELSQKSFPETALLRPVHGVGPLIALGFVATIGDPSRFAKSRTVGAYLGLAPGKRQSGNYDPEMRITKFGDAYLRRLLVSAATRILGPHGADSDLKRYGERISGQGGKRAKSRARIAVARKLAVLLHRLLATGEVYEPLRNSQMSSAA